MLFAGNAGNETEDIDRRHIMMVPVDRAEPDDDDAGQRARMDTVHHGRR